MNRAAIMPKHILAVALCQLGLFLTVVGVTVAAAPAALEVQQRDAPVDDTAEPEFQPIHVLPRQPAIIHPPMLAASDVKDETTDSELVLGVVVNGKARAYPINMLNGPRREIINDTLGDQPIVAMWCHLCHSAIVFDRRVRDQVLTFQVSGMLWNRTLVMYDSETKSLWSLLLVKSMRGPMKGAKLTTLPSDLTTWKKWRTLHPDTTVLNMSKKQDRFVREFYDEPHAFVFGFVADRPRHIAIEKLKEAEVLSMTFGDEQLVATFDEATYSSHLFDRIVDGQVLTFERTQSESGDSFTMTDSETGSVWDAYTGTAIAGPLHGKQLKQTIGTIAYSRNWKAFHPQSRDILIGPQ
jgi:Protein of unknown function (DUF3179)